MIGRHQWSGVELPPRTVREGMAKRIMSWQQVNASLKIMVMHLK